MSGRQGQAAGWWGTVCAAFRTRLGFSHGATGHLLGGGCPPGSYMSPKFCVRGRLGPTAPLACSLGPQAWEFPGRRFFEKRNRS